MSVPMMAPSRQATVTTRKSLEQDRSPRNDPGETEPPWCPFEALSSSANIPPVVRPTRETQMVDSCYICRRTLVDLDRLNEEVRTRVYLSYFSNARNQIDDQRRKIAFLQRLKDEESGDPHFRINAKQVFGDPKAYEKLMPWIDTLIQISRDSGQPVPEQQTMAEFVQELLTTEHRAGLQMEEGLDRLRSGFAPGGKLPFALDEVRLTVPVDWTLDGYPSFRWRAGQANDREPLRRTPGETSAQVEVTLHLCTTCRRLTSGR